MNQQDRSRLLHECEVPVRADRGTAYPCSQRDLDGYVKFHRSNRDRVYLSPNSGTNHLVQWMDINKTPDHQSAAALERLKHGLKIQPWGPDLISKAFKDFDQAFFMGTLTGNVLLRWRKARRINNLWGLRSDGPSYGYTSKMGHGQARITIDPVIHFMSEFNPQSEMFRTLLHEMCHAYLFVVCGSCDNAPGEANAEQAGGGHGLHFRRCIHSVDRRADKFLGLRAIAHFEAAYFNHV